MAHGHNNPGHFGIHTKKYKLIFFYGTDYADTHNKKPVTRHGGNRFGKSTPAAWEFYDLTKDPREMHNRYAGPEYRKVVQSLKAELKKLCRDVGDTDGEYPRMPQDRSGATGGLSWGLERKKKRSRFRSAACRWVASALCRSPGMHPSSRDVAAAS